MLMRILKPMMLLLQGAIILKLTLIWWSAAAKDSLLRRINRLQELGTRRQTKAKEALVKKD